MVHTNSQQANLHRLDLTALQSMQTSLSAFSASRLSCIADEEEIDFEGFIKIMRAGSLESLDHLDQYDARLGTISSPSGKSLPDLIDQ